MLTLKLGNLLLRGGELSKARKLLNQVLSQRPEDADTKSRLGEIELRLGTAHWERAFELLTEELEATLWSKTWPIYSSSSSYPRSQCAVIAR